MVHHWSKLALCLSFCLTGELIFFHLFIYFTAETRFVIASVCSLYMFSGKTKEQPMDIFFLT